MQTQGDIPDEDEVLPTSDTVSKVDIVAEVLDAGGEIHVYLPNLAPGEDIHVKPFRSHVWTDARKGFGLIYVMDGDEEIWIFPEEITHIERHYED